MFLYLWLKYFNFREQLTVVGMEVIFTDFFGNLWGNEFSSLEYDEVNVNDE